MTAWELFFTFCIYTVGFGSYLFYGLAESKSGDDDRKTLVCAFFWPIIFLLVVLVIPLGLIGDARAWFRAERRKNRRHE